MDESENGAARDGRPRVLVVEPNRAYLSVIARRIGEAGYRLAAVDDGQNAMAELHRLNVDVVLAELVMAGTSGVELVRMIRDDVTTCDLPVILIAGRSHTGAAVSALEAGADDVVIKPFSPEVLIARIGRQIERACGLRKLRHDNAALDARVVTRALELGEMRQRWLNSEGERRRLERLIGA
jgi:DNA-binding response OmpR family regulator